MSFMQIKDKKISLYKVTEIWISASEKVRASEIGYCFYGNTTITNILFKTGYVKNARLMSLNSAVIEEKNRICTVQVKPLKMMLHIKPDLTIEDIINGYVEEIPIHKYE